MAKKWTKEEEEFLVKTVKANFHNLSKAFREVASLIGRSEYAVALHWYRKTRLSATCFVAVSQRSKMSNGKNYVPECGHVNSPTSSNKSLWERIKRLLKLK